MRRKYSNEQLLAILRKMPPQVPLSQVEAWVKEIRDQSIACPPAKPFTWIKLTNWNRKN